MKRFILAASLLFTVTSFALPVGNPADPKLLPCSLTAEYCDLSCIDGTLSFRGGFYGDYVFNRYLEVDRNGSDLQTTDIYTNAALLIINYCSRLDLFTTLGASSFHIKTPSSAFRTRGLRAGEYLTIQTETAFSWSLGARAIAYTCRCFDLAVEGQYFRAVPSLNYVAEEDDAHLYLSSSDHFKYQEWQLGVALSRTFYACAPRLDFTPYIGMKWARAKIDMDNLDVVNPNIQTDTYVLYSLESKKHWGYAVGMSIALNDVISVMVERRFGDENALQVNGQIHF